MNACSAITSPSPPPTTTKASRIVKYCRSAVSACRQFLVPPQTMSGTMANIAAQAPTSLKVNQRASNEPEV